MMQKQLQLRVEYVRGGNCPVHELKWELLTKSKEVKDGFSSSYWRHG